MSLTKQQAIKAAPPNWKYTGFWDNQHHYHSGDNRNGYHKLSCSLDQIKNGSLLQCAKRLKQ